MNKIVYDIRLDSHTQELMSLLSEDDIILLTETLRELKYSGWLQHYFQTDNETQKWLYQSSSKQTAHLNELSDEKRVLLVFAAIWHCQLANVCQIAFDDPDIQNLKDSYGRRAARGSVVATGLQALMRRKVGWPFDMDCPFPGWN